MDSGYPQVCQHVGNVMGTLKRKPSFRDRLWNIRPSVVILSWKGKSWPSNIRDPPNKCDQTKLIVVLYNVCVFLCGFILFFFIVWSLFISVHSEGNFYTAIPILIPVLVQLSPMYIIFRRFPIVISLHHNTFLLSADYQNYVCYKTRSI